MGSELLTPYETRYKIDGTDFNAQKALFHERLFLIYQATHAKNKMESELRQSIGLVNQSRESQHVPPLNITDGEFSATLQHLDQGKEVRWKKGCLDRIKAQ
jgi:hypothetical protein